MKRKMLWLVVSGLMALSLVMAACGPAAVEEKKAPAVEEKQAPVVGEKKQEAPAVEKVQQATVIDQKGGAVPIVVVATEPPRYGGTLMLVESSDSLPRSDTTLHTTASTFINLVNEELTGGDWTLGPAGGWGTNVANWAGNPDRWEHRTGVIAESWKWTIDSAKNEGTIVYQIRQGIHWALDPKSEASRLVGGREFTAEDAVFHMKRTITEKTAYFYLTDPQLRPAQITATGRYEVTVKIPIEGLISAIGRFGDSMQFEAPEVIKKYGSQKTWKEMVGTGPYMMTDYIPGSMIVKQKNPNYWLKDPIGPGQGNQLPYIDTIKYLVLPDASTRQAAFRTGKVDMISGDFTMDDLPQLLKQLPMLLGFGEGGVGQSIPTVNWRTDIPPFNDVRVRRALHLAIPFEELNQTLFRGRGEYPGRPFPLDPSYKELYLGLDDRDMPPEVRELWEYKPEKAKQLLKEAGYPAGLKVKVVMTAGSVDAWSIYKDIWAKIGVELVFDIKESGAFNSLMTSRTYEQMVVSTGNPIGVWYSMPAYTGASSVNRSMVDDPVINETMAKIRTTFLTEGETPAFRMLRELTKHIYWQVYEISSISLPITTRYWWPWLKNYSGEANVGYFNAYWMKFVWIDQDLKKSMGY